MLKCVPPLDRDFTPMSIALRDFDEDVRQSCGQHIAISIIRNQGYTSTYSMRVFKDGEQDARNCALVERIVKSLLWIKGGYKVILSGSQTIYEHIQKVFSATGARAFDFHFMAKVFEQPFSVEHVKRYEDAPKTRESANSIGRHLNGCRIGFDAGGSDRKVSAVVDGEAVYSEEVIWNPKTESDPQYHYLGILESMKTAASKMPRVDAIGVSSAGIYVGNRVMAASLFLKIPEDLFETKVKNMYIDVAKEFGDVPLEVANDGDVTALAGAMDLDDDCVLGVAMGTSEAGGYVDASGNITGWLNELAFVPIDHRKVAEDEWSGDFGCGVKYFSQDAVIRLAPEAGIAFPEGLSLAEKLKFVQDLQAKSDPRTEKIYETIGIYFGYAIAYYASFYDIRHVLVMGRVTSGTGGVILLDKAREVLIAEFPDLASKVNLAIPDETSRRVGQSVAAASLPKI